MELTSVHQHHPRLLQDPRVLPLVLPPSFPAKVGLITRRPIPVWAQSLPDARHGMAASHRGPRWGSTVVIGALKYLFADNGVKLPIVYELKRERTVWTVHCNSKRGHTIAREKTSESPVCVTNTACLPSPQLNSNILAWPFLLAGYQFN